VCGKGSKSLVDDLALGIAFVIFVIFLEDGRYLEISFKVNN